ncbi:MAG: TIGR01777 family oxidoreductase [bacterium]
MTGATGFIGGRILAGLDDVVALSRDPDRARPALGPGVEVHRWDPMTGPPPEQAFRGVQGVIHLAGEPVDGRWTAEKKRKIRESRVRGTRNLVAAMLDLEERPGVLVSASAVGYYGDRGEELLTEDADPGSIFLSEVCEAWEREARKAENAGIRVVNPRIGLVMGEEGGAMEKLLPLFKLGLGGRMGSGEQYWPWVHIEDVTGIFQHALREPELSGPVNAVAPAPVQNRVFTRVLGRVLRRPALFPVPAFALRLMLGEFAIELLASRRAVPREAEDAGYTFRHPELVESLYHLTGREMPSSAGGRRHPPPAS